MHHAVIAIGGFAMLTPDRALLLLTLGVLLIYVELNRPGKILPGALGLLASLFALASLLRLDLNAGAVALVCTAVALLLLDLLRHTTPIIAIAATFALVLGFDHLIQGGSIRVHTVTAVACGVLIGTGTSILTRIARRARTNKGLD